MAVQAAPEQLLKAVAKLPSGKTSTFATVDEAAERRAAKNVVPDRSFTVDCARVLATRGLRPVSGGGFTWVSDPWLLLPTRLYVPEPAQRAFAQRIHAPTLFVLTRDGVFGRLMRTPVLRSLGEPPEQGHRTRPRRSCARLAL